MKFVQYYLLGWSLAVSMYGSPKFDDHFLNKTLRIDFYHIGHAKEELFSVDRFKVGAIWAGKTKSLLDPFNNGQYYIKILDAHTEDLVYSQGFNSIFGEYQTTSDGLKGIRRTFQESALIPYPKKTVKFHIEKRDVKNTLKRIFECELDPGKIVAAPEFASKSVKVYPIHTPASPHDAVDVAIIGEGYTEAEELKFQNDLTRIKEVLLRTEPYASMRQKINVYGIFKPSEESGCSEPGYGHYKQTIAGATFDAFGVERYILSEDNKAIRDLAAHVPYDAIVLMINHKRYGGGGIYNLYATFTVDNPHNEHVFLHEFGHSFAGLADEYYTSVTAYNDFYPAGIEPTEPNITALLDPKMLKWSKLASPNITIPTSWEKEEFDRMDLAYQKNRQELNAQIAQLKKAKASLAEILQLEADAEKLSMEHTRKSNVYLEKCLAYGKVGAFEGAGYSSKGLYRPMLKCMMFSKGTTCYCDVCTNAISQIIQHFVE